MPETAVHGLSPLVIGVTTPMTTRRDGPRRQVRAVLLAVLAARLGCEASQLRLSSTPGQPPRLEGMLGAGLHLSISHAPGLSLLAIDPQGAVGVDLMHVEQELVGVDDWVLLARDYLGPAVAARLRRSPQVAQPALFARAWTAHEARLKCLGLRLQELTSELHQALGLLQSVPLALPAGYVGCLSRT